MSNPAKDKGSRVERELAAKFTDAGVPTQRVQGSGAWARYDESLAGDLKIGTGINDSYLYRAEVKARKKFSTKQLDKWLRDDDLLLLRKDGDLDPMVYMPWKTLLPMLQVYYAFRRGVSSE